MKKRFALSFIIFFCLVVFFSWTTPVYAEDDVYDNLNDTVENQLNSIDWEGLQAFLEEYGEDEYNLLNGSVLDKIKQILSGELTADASTFLQFVFSALFSRLKSLLPIIMGIAVICIFSGLVDKTKCNLLNNSTSGLISFFCFATVLMLLLAGVWNLLETAKNTIFMVKRLSNLAMPILLTFMAATGATTSAKVYSPAVALLSEGVTEIVANVGLPMFIFSVVFSVIGNLSSEIKLEKLSTFFKNVSSWILGITFTVFTGFLAVQGLTASTIDGISIRAAKFATKTYIPILGGYLADGFDLILASCVLIKNSLGVVVLLILLSVVLAPVFSIIVFNLGLQLICALTEPIADPKIVKFLTDIGKNLSILLVCVLAVTFMLFIMVMLIIFSANLL